MKPIWRLSLFIVTLMFIYLLFPILIVPSSLPAIQQMFVENEFPQRYPTTAQSQNETDLTINQLEIPTIPTIKDKIELLTELHSEGVDLILGR